MQLDITGHQIDLTDSLQSFVRDKFKKLERHSNQLTHVHVILGVEHSAHQAEATAHMPGAELFANAEAEDMYSSIDQMINKLDRQVLKHKEITVARDHGGSSHPPES